MLLLLRSRLGWVMATLSAKPPTPDQSIPSASERSCGSSAKDTGSEVSQEPGNGSHDLSHTDSLECQLLSRWRTLRATYRQDWGLPTLEQSIETLRELRDALLNSAAPTASPPTGLTLQSPENHNEVLSLHSCSYYLAISLGDRFEHRSDKADLDEGVALLREIVASDLITTAFIQGQIGNLHRLRYLQTEDTQDINAAHAALSAAVSSTSGNHPSRAWCLYQLGRALKLKEREDPSVFETWLSALQEAVEIGLAEDWHPWARLGLAEALTWRFIRAGQLTDLDQVFEICQSLLGSISPNHRDRGEVLVAQGRAYFHLYQTTDEMNHLEAAVLSCREALSCVTPARPLWCSYAYFVAVNLLEVFNNVGTAEALDEATELTRQCVQANSASHGRYLNGLANIYISRYQVFGGKHDLDEGIAIYRQAKGYFRPQTLPWNNFVRSFTSALLTRFQERGWIEDCLEAIPLLRQVLQNPIRHIVLEDMFRDNLVRVLVAGYEQTNNLDYLIEATHLCEPWMASLSDDAKTSRVWNNVEMLITVARVFEARFNSMGQLADLESIIFLRRRAVALTPPGSRNYVLYIVSLARYIGKCAVETSSEEDARIAVELLDTLLLDISPEHHDRGLALFAQAKLALLPITGAYNVCFATDMLNAALDSLDVHNAPKFLPEVADFLEELDKQIDRNTPSQLQEILLALYRRVISLLPKAAYLGLELSLRLRTLAGSSESLAINGALRALAAGQLFLAVELLEQGRAVFWRHHLQLRAQWDGLPEELATQVSETAFLLDSGSNVHVDPASEADDVSKALREREAVKLKHLSHDFDALLAQIHGLPGLERFLMPEPLSVLCSAAEKGPVVILLANVKRCSAIILEQAGLVREVELRNTSLQTLEELSTTMNTASRYGRNLMRERVSRINLGESRGRTVEQVLSYLWMNVMQPLVNTLGTEVSLRNAV